MATEKVRDFGQGREPIPQKIFLNKFNKDTSSIKQSLNDLRKNQIKMGIIEKELFNMGVDGKNMRTNVRFLVSPFLPFRDHPKTYNFLKSDLRTNRKYNSSQKTNILNKVEEIFNLKREIKGLQNYLRGDRIS